MKRYYSNIDYLKGILIIFVILGHVIQGEINKSLVRHMIYFFHMPLFIGISGYLFNIEELNKNFLKGIKKFVHRLILPWIGAVVLYTFLLNIKEVTSGNFLIILIIKTIKGLISPYYHLWYILGYLSWIIILFLLLKTKKSNVTNFIFAFIMSIFMYIVYFYSNVNSTILNIFLKDFQLHNFIFFYFGYWLKENIKNTSRDKLIISILGLFISSIITFYFKNKIFVILLFYIANIYLILISIKYSVTIKQITNNNIICKIGKYSLEIYLLHVIPILIGKYLMNIDNWKFNTVVFLLEILLIAIIIKIKKIMER